MAKQATATLEQKPSVFARVREFYDEVKWEMGKVTWPTKDELKSSTSVVLLLLGIITVVVYVFDIVFQYSIMGLLKSLAK
jgi:preprotein translocase subunit SecE